MPPIPALVLGLVGLRFDERKWLAGVGVVLGALPFALLSYLAICK